MKYIKTYEAMPINRIIPKYDEGEPVKIKDDNTNTLYVVSGYDYRKNTNIKDLVRLQRYVDKDKYADSEDFFRWELEEDLMSVEDYELAANKYNI